MFSCFLLSNLFGIIDDVNVKWVLVYNVGGFVYTALFVWSFHEFWKIRKPRKLIKIPLMKNKWKITKKQTKLNLLEKPFFPTEMYFLSPCYTWRHKLIQLACHPVSVSLYFLFDFVTNFYSGLRHLEANLALFPEKNAAYTLWWVSVFSSLSCTDTSICCSMLRT